MTDAELTPPNSNVPPAEPEGAPAAPATVAAPDQAEADAVKAKEDAAAATLANVPTEPQLPTREELDAQSQAKASIPMVETPTGPTPAPAPGPLATPEVEAGNPSNVQSAEVNPAVAENIAQADAAIAADAAPSTPPTGPPPPPVFNPSDVGPPKSATPPSATDDDGRQQWVCVTTEGERTVKDGVYCPVFSSDNQLLGLTVTCPNCNSSSVIRKEGWTRPL